jgi:hypothetical protein
LSADAVAAVHLRQALHVDSFDPAAVRRFACLGSWILSASFPLVPALICAAVCSVLACNALLVGASVADAAVPAGERELAAGLVHSCLQPLSLPPSSRVAGSCPPSFRLRAGAEAEALLGQGVVPDLLFF